MIKVKFAILYEFSDKIMSSAPGPAFMTINSYMEIAGHIGSFQLPRFSKNTWTNPKQPETTT